MAGGASKLADVLDLVESELDAIERSAVTGGLPPATVVDALDTIGDTLEMVDRMLPRE
jgi:hypothetical protein